MKKLYYKGALVIETPLLENILSFLHQFNGAEIRTTDKINYFLILND